MHWDRTSHPAGARRPAAGLALLSALLLLAGCQTAETAGGPAPATDGAAAPTTAGLTVPPATGGPVAPPATVGATDVIVYAPPAPSGAEMDGTCFAASQAVWREGAYRCSAGNEILDPCFAVEGATDAVVCGGDPAVAETPTFRLRVTDPLPTEKPVTDPRHAWQVRLSDGTVCGFMTGATAGVEGERLNYGCTDQSWLAGDLVPGDVWTARRVSLNDQLTPEASPAEVDIKIVWQ
jgi:hypothetical protein